ncbi:MAG TPA: nuclear transport factor 2 family protein [Candidatus Acidoferrales bacterium]|nr:nuclear transport factor 2 family protein [Candidatus Acidoferrales bacterium]
MIDLQEIEAIKRLKYRYLRCLDQKKWDELADCFALDARVAYGDGQYSFEGRERIMDFLRSALSATTKLTSHRCHQPEIELLSPTTAKGTWALDDVVIDTRAQITLRGAAFYEDEYVKQDGAWKITFTGYKRQYEEIESRGDTPSLKLTASWWPLPAQKD